MNIHLLPLARSIDQTNLSPTADAAEIRDFARQAEACRFRAVAVMLSWIPLVTSVLHGSETTVVAPVGFPLGSGTTAAKVAEAQWALQHGPRDVEIDMVMNMSWFKSGELGLTAKDIGAVRKTIGSNILKVIIEVPVLSATEIAIASRIAEEAGADYVKTSTGFKYLPGWRASTAADVKLIEAAIGDRLQIKVAGGISTLDQAFAVLEAGASRIGTSSGHIILQEYSERCKQGRENDEPEIY